VTTVFPGFVSGAGLFADSGTKLPPGVGTSPPEAVAKAVIEGIQRNRAEIDVAPIGMRWGTRASAFAPSLGAAITRALGGGKIAASLAEGQRDKR
jgi:uncharacterized protein